MVAVESGPGESTMDNGNGRTDVHNRVREIGGRSLLVSKQEGIDAAPGRDCNDNGTIGDVSVNSAR